MIPNLGGIAQSVLRIAQSQSDKLQRIDIVLKIENCILGPIGGEYEDICTVASGQGVIVQSTIQSVTAVDLPPAKSLTMK